MNEFSLLFSISRRFLRRNLCRIYRKPLYNPDILYQHHIPDPWHLLFLPGFPVIVLCMTYRV